MFPSVKSVRGQKVDRANWTSYTIKNFVAYKRIAQAQQEKSLSLKTAQGDANSSETYRGETPIVFADQKHVEQGSKCASIAGICNRRLRNNTSSPWYIAEPLLYERDVSAHPGRRNMAFCHPVLSHREPWKHGLMVDGAEKLPGTLIKGRLLQAPNPTTLFEVLCRFRVGRAEISGGTRGMFLQVKLAGEGRNPPVFGGAPRTMYVNR